MKILTIIGAALAYIVILILTLMVLHYMFVGVRSAFRSVFGRHQ